MKSFSAFISLLVLIVLPRLRAQRDAAASATPPLNRLDPVTVTGTREKAPLYETPSAIGAISGDTIRDTAPLHPGQLLGQVPGVAVAVTNGEGHTTAIRQPFTTSPVYLFLEDGIPIRATGFFNHNALYEVNIPLAASIEVIRGPGTALYGSDAIGGIVNVVSRAPFPEWHGSATAEVGAFGTWRAMFGGGDAWGRRGAFEASLNLTHVDGWRERTGYDRVTGNYRWDESVGDGATLKTSVAVSKIDQQTGANSPLTYGDYMNRPTRNLLPVAYRKVRAVRASAEYERQYGRGLLSLIPYFRDDGMELNGSYNLNSDPRIETTHNVSYGLLAKARRSLPAWRARLIGGIDVDYSPGTRREDNLLLTRSGSGADTLVSAYAIGRRIYDYAVTFHGVSPYLHTECSPSDSLRLTAGLRYDALGFDFRNRLPPGAAAASVLGATRYYGQLPDTATRFARFSPKLGATYAFTHETHVYASYNVGFRAPSENQLYRAGNDTTAANALAKARAALGLRPIEAAQIELGMRGAHGFATYDFVGYVLTKRNDLVTQRDLATNVTTAANAGRTEHRGLEAAIGVEIGHGVRLETSLAYSQQRYVEWKTASANFNGKDIEAAPHVLANTRLTWRRTDGAMLQVEWSRVGSYWLEPGNASQFGKYPGHDLLNLRGRYAVSRQLFVSARLMNALGRRFADSASVVSNTPVFSPGLPRAIYAGLEYNW